MVQICLGFPMLKKWVVVAVLNVSFSLITFPLYSDSSNVNQLIQRFEEINQSIIEQECTSDNAPTSIQYGTSEQLYLLAKFELLSHNDKKFVCSEKLINGCIYNQCVSPLNMFKSYPQPIVILIPKDMTEIKSYRVHFHGFSHFNMPYDRNIDSMVKAFEFGKSTCRTTSELTILPFSKNNKNTHHHTYLASTKKFDGFMKEFQQLIGDTKKLPVKLSGHSGGGKVVSKIVSYMAHDANSESATRRVQAVDVYDGLYGSSWVENYASWFEKSKGVDLNIYSIKNSRTHNLSHALFNRFGDNAQTIKKNHPGTNRSYSLSSNQWGENKIKLIQEKARGGDHHWEMNRDFWDLEID